MSDACTADLRPRAQTAADTYRRGRTQSRRGYGDHRKQGPQKNNLMEKRKKKETSTRC